MLALGWFPLRLDAEEILRDPDGAAQIVIYMLARLASDAREDELDARRAGIAPIGPALLTGTRRSATMRGAAPRR